MKSCFHLAFEHLLMVKKSTFLQASYLQVVVYQKYGVDSESRIVLDVRSFSELEYEGNLS